MSVPGGRGVAGALLLVAAISLPFLLDDYGVYILNLALVYAIIVIGLNVAGLYGDRPFAQVAPTGIGDSATAILMTRLAWPFWVTLPAAGIVTSLIGSICTLPSLRMRSVYLAPSPRTSCSAWSRCATGVMLDERGAEERVRELSTAVRARRRSDRARVATSPSASSSASRS